jgi:hypothetical protein
MHQKTYESYPISIIFSWAHMPSLTPFYCQMILETPPITKVATNDDNSSRLALGFKQFQWFLKQNSIHKQSVQVYCSHGGYWF